MVLADTWFMIRSRCVAFALGLRVSLAALVPAAHAVIVMGSGDPAFNDYAQNPPTGDLAQSGGQFEVMFHDFLGTAIAPQFFLTAHHIGGTPGDTFTFNGVTYTTTATFADPAGTDLQIWQTSGTFPIYAPLYPGTTSEVGQMLVAYGRGTQRGDAVTMGGATVGWLWGNGDSVMRWGVNTVSSIVDGGSLGMFLYAIFDQPPLGLGDFECHLSVGDSGGGLFIQDPPNSGVWKLAGIHYAVDGPFSTVSSGMPYFNAALFDGRGFYVDDQSSSWPLFAPASDPNPAPTGFYSSQVSARLAWILSVITPEADEDGDGLPDLAEYAFGSPPLVPSPEALPVVSLVQSGSDQFLAISYSQLDAATDVNCTVEVSADLQTWNSGDDFTTLVSDVDNNGSQRITVRDNAPQSSNPQRFIRVRVSRPALKPSLRALRKSR
jgi:hypothetical protein